MVIHDLLELLLIILFSCFPLIQVENLSISWQYFRVDFLELRVFVLIFRVDIDSPGHSDFDCKHVRLIILDPNFHDSGISG